MNDAALTELRDLRARVYGRSADAADTAARARLDELESMMRADSEVAEDGVQRPVPPLPAEPAAAAAERLPPGAPPADRPGTVRQTPGARAVMRTSWRRRPVAIVWVGSLAAVAVVAAGVSGVAVAGAMTRHQAAEQMGQRVADLTDPVPTEDWLTNWFDEPTKTVVYEYHGLTVARSATSPFAIGTDCLTVMPTDGFDAETGGLTGDVYAGCSAGAFPASVQFVVDTAAPQELRDVFPAGTALRFVREEAGVGVFRGAADRGHPQNAQSAG